MPVMDGLEVTSNMNYDYLIYLPIFIDDARDIKATQLD